MSCFIVRLSVVAIFLPLVACHPLEDAYCGAMLPKPGLDIVTVPPHYALEQNRSARQLGDAHASDGERITYGLTTAMPMTRAEIKLHVAKLPGAVCVRPDIQVTLAYQPMQVDLAEELARGSCPYETVLGHELKHVEAYRVHLATVATTLKAEIQARVASHLPARYASLEASETAMQAFQDEWLVPRANDLLGRVTAEQSAVDSAAEYARVASACPGDALLSGATAPR